MAEAITWKLEKDSKDHSYLEWLEKELISRNCGSGYIEKIFSFFAELKMICIEPGLLTLTFSEKSVKFIMKSPHTCIEEKLLEQYLGDNSDSEYRKRIKQKWTELAKKTQNRTSEAFSDLERSEMDTVFLLMKFAKLDYSALQMEYLHSSLTSLSARVNFD